MIFRTPGSRALLTSLVVASCGGADTHRETAIAAHPSTPPVRPTADAPALVATLPHHTALRAAIDPARIGRWLGRIASVVDPRAVAEAMRVFHLDERSLIEGHLAESLGVDPTRAIQIGLASIDDASRPEIERLHASAIALRQNDAARVDEAMASFDGEHHALISLRAIVPIRDLATLRETVRNALAEQRWTAATAPAGIDEFYVHRSDNSAIAVSHNTDTLVIDLLVAPLATRGDGDVPADAFVRRLSDAARALRLRTADAPHDDALALEGDAFRVQYAPADLAPINFFYGLGAISSALRAVDPSMRRQIATVGMLEAVQSFDVAGNARGPYFDRLTIDVTDQPSFAMRVEPGRGAEIPNDAAWVETPSFDTSPVLVQFDASSAFVRGWHLPGDDASPRSSRQFRVSVAEAGGLATMMSLPFALIDGLRRSLDDPMGRFPGSPAALARFERVGVATVAMHDVQVGLFPASTRESTAVCVFQPAARCNARNRLVVDRTVTEGASSARLVRVGDRFALLVGRNADSVRTAQLRLTAAPVAAARFHADLGQAGAANPLAAAFPGAIDGAVHHEGSAWIFEAHPAP